VVELIGFARTPPSVAAHLVAAGEAVAAASGRLDAWALGSAGAGAIEADRREAAGQSREALDAIAATTGWGLDRGDVIELASALRELADRVAGVALGLERVDAVTRRNAWAGPSGVLRDLTRALATAVRTLDGPGDQREAALAAVEPLRHEGRRRLCDARRLLVAVDGDPWRRSKPMTWSRATSEPSPPA
jgi:hypothetical protein